MFSKIIFLKVRPSILTLFPVLYLLILVFLLGQVLTLMSLLNSPASRSIASQLFEALSVTVWYLSSIPKTPVASLSIMVSFEPSSSIAFTSPCDHLPLTTLTQYEKKRSQLLSPAWRSMCVCELVPPFRGDITVPSLVLPCVKPCNK